MEFIKNIYVEDEDIDVENVKNMMSQGIAIFNLYLICIDKNGVNMAEILHSPDIFKPNNINKKFICIGLATGKKKSFELFSRIIKEYVETGNGLDDFKNNI